ESGRTQISETAYYNSGPSGSAFQETFCAWFEYYWGKSGKNIHTLIFDFDDTLADTGYIQIEAWVEALESLPMHRRDILAEDVLRNAEAGELSKLITRRFTDLQMAVKIADSLFKKDISDDTRQAAVQELQQRRLSARTRRTRQAGLFPNVD